MLSFAKIDNDLLLLKKYFDNTPINFCDYSVGVRYMWRKNFECEYAIYNDTLILKENSSLNNNSFFYPIGKDVDGAITEIENYCKKNNIPVSFCYVDNARAVDVCSRFYFTTLSNDRDWSDYIYDANSFKNFVGKKYSGQRNHINKFKKTYPNYSVEEITQRDISDIKNFLLEFEKENTLTEITAIEEDNNLTDYVDNMFYLSQVGLLVRLEGKIIAFSIGEVVGDTLVIHVEKALTEYEGIYPFIANEFAKRNVNETVKYINREEDCGDQGLRISKLQYHPIEVKEKNSIVCHTTFDRLITPVYLHTKRLVIKDIVESDKEKYYNLYIDDELNKFWGYDYREDLNGQISSPDYFFDFQNKLKEKKEEYSLGVYLDKELIGEVVLHNFGYHGDVEIGFRIFKKYQKKGYALESVSRLIEYVFNDMHVPIIKGKCYKLNKASESLFNNLGFSRVQEDEKYYYFIKKK